MVSAASTLSNRSAEGEAEEGEGEEIGGGGAPITTESCEGRAEVEQEGEGGDGDGSITELCEGLAQGEGEDRGAPSTSTSFTDSCEGLKG